MKTASAFINHEPEQAPSLPELVTTKGGATFDPNAPIWSYRDGADTLNLTFSFEEALDASARLGLRGTLAWYAENHSPSHLENTHAAIRKFIGLIASERMGGPIVQFEAVHVLSHRKSMTHAMKRLAALLKKWHSLGYAGVSDSVVAVFEDMTIKGNNVGDAVRTRDPIKGPFSDIERSGIEDALNIAYSEGTVSEECYLLAWLFMAVGARPIQFASMKVCDVLAVTGDDGHTQYSIRVPRAKQRADLRDDFKNRLLVPQIGKHLLEYADRVRDRFARLAPDPSTAPLFPDSRLCHRRSADAGNERWNSYHRSAGALGATLSGALSKLEVRSERTGEYLHINPRRFRYTFGTNAAREGHGVLVVAELLDHSGVETAGTYVAAAPEMAVRIERATAMQLAPIAQAFKGVLIHEEAEATRGTDPSSRIIDLRIDRTAKPMGSCGQHGFCGFLAPIACYTCSSFEPWADGPHEAVLDYLIAQREQHAGDSRVAGISDRSILAVAEVVRRCRSLKEEHQK